MSAYSILKTIASASKAVFDIVKDKTSYSTTTDELIKLAIGFYDKGDYDTALTMMIAIANDIDSSDFHKFHIFQFRNHDARRQYNKMCLYIAKIYDERNDYYQVKKWADKLAYLPHESVDKWESILDSDDFEELNEKFDNRDEWNDAASDSLNDYLTRPCD